MEREVRLEELNWTETQELQDLMRAGAFWDDFPAIGYTLVRAEFKANTVEIGASHDLL
jgi:hypothetical protein